MSAATLKSKLRGFPAGSLTVRIIAS